MKVDLMGFAGGLGPRRWEKQRHPRGLHVLGLSNGRMESPAVCKRGLTSGMKLKAMFHSFKTYLS